MARHSITRRLTLLFAGTLSAGFLILGWYMSSEIERHFVELDQASLDSAVRRVIHVINNELSGSDLDRLHALLDSILAGHDRISLWVTTDADEPLATDSEITFPKEPTESAMSRAASGASVLFDWEQDGSHYRGLAKRVHAESFSPKPLKVAAAMNIDHHVEFMAMFRGALWVAVAGAIIVSVLISIAIARAGVRPLLQLAQQIDEISSQRLNQALATENVPVELISLVHAFNAMLARRDSSFVRLSQFSADIAHELRTPVSNLLTQTQVMLSKERSVEEYREVLASNAEELERMSRMVADMLFLAKTDDEPSVILGSTVDVGSEVGDLFEFYEALAAERSVGLELSGTLMIEGDRLMLRRGINNLLSNAIRFTPAGGTVRVSLESTGNKGIINVTNPGEPIPEGVRERLFERFYRADAARSRDTEGAGLGLAIVKAIAEAHGGGVGVTSSESGNTFT
ncbi:MAG: heavy metal sensor histidine kinase, partial [Betaproteobacteria bacterium]